MKEETKPWLLCLLAVALTAEAIFYLGFSNELESVGIVAVIIFAIIAFAGVAIAAVNISVAIAIIISTIIISATAALTGKASSAVGFLLLSFSLIFALMSDLEAVKKGRSSVRIAVILVIMLIMFSPFVFISRYHNEMNLKRDENIAQMVTIATTATGKLELLLPAQFVQNQRYLAQTLIVKADGRSFPWKDCAIRCSEGKKVWYKIPLPKVGTVNLLFSHPWENYETTRTLPVPTSFPFSEKK